MGQRDRGAAAALVGRLAFWTRGLRSRIGSSSSEGVVRMRLQEPGVGEHTGRRT
jgi:hypothetical protein